MNVYLWIQIFCILIRQTKILEVLSDHIEKSSARLKVLEDFLIQQYYLDYYQEISSKELDQEFSKDLKVITKALKKLPDENKSLVIELLLYRLIESYVDRKVEKELDISLKKILKW